MFYVLYTCIFIYFSSCAFNGERLNMAGSTATEQLSLTVSGVFSHKSHFIFDEICKDII